MRELAATEPLCTGTAAEPLDWLEEASSLEDQILQQARRTPDGEVVWLHPRSSREGRAQPVGLGPHLYDGVAGVALFLAAMEHVEAREGRRGCILSAIGPLRRHLKKMAADREVAGGLPFGLGGFTGLGGVIYAFLLLGGWLGEPELIEEAAETATLVTPDRISADGDLDVMSGCAGMALALLALEQAAPGPVRGKTPAERAAECGEHLLVSRVSAAGQPRAWAARNHPPRCGFAHGAAGIAYCLMRLFERTGDARFRDAAEEGAAFEHLHYDPEHSNWPLLGLSGLHFMTSWCSGAPGVALGRLGLLALDSGSVRQDLRAALSTTSTCATLPVDSLCCGNMGRSEILLQAHKVLGEESLLEAAEVTASRAVLRSRQQGGRYCCAAGENPFSPSLFTGMAGVGYALLRLARPEILPCVLSLEVVE